MFATANYASRLKIHDGAHDYSCSLEDAKVHGSEVDHWLSGTPSSKSLTMTAEKLDKKKSLLTGSMTTQEKHSVTHSLKKSPSSAA